MNYIKAIFNIDRDATFQITGKLETRYDYLYGGIRWIKGYKPIPFKKVAETILRSNYANQDDTDSFWYSERIRQCQ